MTSNPERHNRGRHFRQALSKRGEEMNNSNVAAILEYFGYIAMDLVITSCFYPVSSCFATFDLVQILRHVSSRLKVIHLVAATRVVECN
jgi:hypothetical protein